jgi:hypothetical protein
VHPVAARGGLGQQVLVIQRLQAAAGSLQAGAVQRGGGMAVDVGAGITIVAIQTGTAAVLLLGTGVAGLGYGTAFLGAYRTVVALASPSDRAGLIAAIFSVSYLAMGLPTLMAGISGGIQVTIPAGPGK